MCAQRLNAAEKDLEKFIKFLAMKSTQVVVQSRLGEKIQTKCHPLAGNDWFNIVVHDHPDVHDETKRALSLNPGESVMQRLPLCIEISLRTVEGDHMVLEVWSLDLVQSANGTQLQKDDKLGGVGTNVGIINNTSNNANDSQTLRAAHAIYNRMGIMLKSLISLTRATPAYKLSRRQCPDSYSIYYRIYVDRPQMHTLGEGHKNVKIGQLNTIVGSLVMSVAYRTKMTITPTTAQSRNADDSIMLKSDHFRPTDTPTLFVPGFKKIGGAGTNGCDKLIDIDKPLRPGAFTDVGKLKIFTDEDYKLPETPPFEWLIRRARHESIGSGSIESLNNRMCDSPVLGANGQPPQQLNNIINNNNNNNNINNLNHNNNSTAFKSFEKTDSSNSKATTQTNGAAAATATDTAAAAAVIAAAAGSFVTSPIKSLLIPAPIRQSSISTLPAVQQTADEDNLLKELNFPFASTVSHMNDLAKFYRECYHAPPLRGINEIQAEICLTTSTSSSNSTNNACAAAAMINSSSSSESCAVDDLSRQLEQFETSLEDYDKLVSQFGLTVSSSTGSRSSGGLQMSN